MGITTISSLQQKLIIEDSAYRTGMLFLATVGL